MKLLLVGCGHMGSALLERWRQSPPAGLTHFDVIAPHHSQTDTPQLTWHKSLEFLPATTSPGIVVFAVKPQKLAELLPSYSARFGYKPLYMSVAAGKTLAFYQEHLGRDAAIVRAMPNTPSLIGQGMTGLCCSAGLSNARRDMAEALMRAVGEIAWASEDQMDALTAISGCGPAYVFLFLEALTKGGIAAGLLENVAKRLALETVRGSVALAGESKESFAQLVQNVASPGGSTEAALKVLKKENALENLVTEAVLSAAKRSKELAK